MCGIFGVEGSSEAANLTYLGLYALQHRGQESAGIVSWDGSTLHVERGMGEVADIFKARTLARLPGERALGHTRYSTSGGSVVSNAQPLVVNTSMGPLGLVHNGNLVNALPLRRKLEEEGAIFQTTSDTEVILHLMARNPRKTVVESLMVALQQVRGAYSVILISSEGMLAARDPHGFRPLMIGEADGAFVFASESCAFDLMEAKPLRDVGLGEVVLAKDGQLESFSLPKVPSASHCIFEHVYLSRPDSIVFGEDVSEARLQMGAQLAREAPVPADLVVPVPDSGVFSALGYARESGLQFELGLIRNHYVGRTFIEPQQSIRHFGVKVKLNPVRGLLRGKRVVLVDDSIVRGTTSQKIVRMVRDAGASEVHVRITSPPTAFPCHYGIDTPTREELIAARLSVEETRAYIDADSLAYISVEGLLACGSKPPEAYCTACFTGSYPVPFEKDDRQGELFPIRLDASEESY